MQIFVDITADSEIFDSIKAFEGPINDEFIEKWLEEKMFVSRKALFEITPTADIFKIFPCLTMHQGLDLVTSTSIFLGL